MFTCPVCGVSFTKASSLLKHLASFKTFVNSGGTHVQVHVEYFDALMFIINLDLNDVECARLRKTLTSELKLYWVNVTNFFKTSNIKDIQELGERLRKKKLIQ